MHGRQRRGASAQTNASEKHVPAFGGVVRGGRGREQRAQQFAGCRGRGSVPPGPCTKVDVACVCLIALQLQVQVYARSSGVCVVVDDAGAGLRKMPQPGDEVGHGGGWSVVGCEVCVRV